MIRKADPNQVKVRYAGSIDIHDSTKKSLVKSNGISHIPNPPLSFGRKRSTLQASPTSLVSQENHDKPLSHSTKHYKEKRVRQYKISFAYTCSSGENGKDTNPKITGLKRLDQDTTNSDHQFVTDKLKPVMSQIVQRLIQEYKKSKLNIQSNENEDKSVSANSITLSISGSENFLRGTIKTAKLSNYRKSISPYLVNSYTSSTTIGKNVINISLNHSKENVDVVKGHSTSRTIKSPLKPNTLKQIKRLQKYQSSFKLDSLNTNTEFDKNESLEIILCGQKNFIQPSLVKDNFIFKKEKFIQNLDDDIAKLFDRPIISVYDLSFCHKFSSITISNLIYVYSSIIFHIFSQDLFKFSLENLLSYRRNIHFTQFDLVKDVNYYHVEVAPKLNYICIAAHLEKLKHFKQRSVLNKNFSNDETEISKSGYDSSVGSSKLITYTESSTEKVSTIKKLFPTASSSAGSTVKQKKQKPKQNSKTVSLSTENEESLSSDITVMSDCPICHGDPIICLEAEGRKSLIENYVNLLQESDGIIVKRLSNNSIDMNDLKALLYNFMAKNDAYPSPKIKEEMLKTQGELMRRIQSGEEKENKFKFDKTQIENIINERNDKNRRLPQHFLKSWSTKLDDNRLSIDVEVDDNVVSEFSDKNILPILYSENESKEPSHRKKSVTFSNLQDLKHHEKLPSGSNYELISKSKADLQHVEIGEIDSFKTIENSLQGTAGTDTTRNSEAVCNIVKEWLKSNIPLQEAINDMRSNQITSDVVISSYTENQISKIDLINNTYDATDSGLILPILSTVPYRQSLKVRKKPEEVISSQRINKSKLDQDDNEVNKSFLNNKNEDKGDTANKVENKFESEGNDKSPRVEVVRISLLNNKLQNTDKLLPNSGVNRDSQKRDISSQIKGKSYLKNDELENSTSKIKETENADGSKTKEGNNLKIEQFSTDDVYVEVESKRASRILFETDKKESADSDSLITISLLDPDKNISTFEDSLWNGKLERNIKNNSTKSTSASSDSQATSDDFSGKYLNETSDFINIFNKISWENSQDLLNALKINSPEKGSPVDMGKRGLNEDAYLDAKYNNLKHVSSSFKGSPPMVYETNITPTGTGLDNFGISGGNKLGLLEASSQGLNHQEKMINAPISLLKDSQLGSHGSQFNMHYQFPSNKESSRQIEDQKFSNGSKAQMKSILLNEIEEAQIRKSKMSPDDLSANQYQSLMTNNEVTYLLESLKSILSKSEEYLNMLSNLNVNLEKHSHQKDETINIPKDFYFLLKSICQNKENNELDNRESAVSNEKALNDICKMLGLIDVGNAKDTSKIDTKNTSIEELGKMMKNVLDKENIDQNSIDLNDYSKNVDKNFIDKVVKCVLQKLVENNKILVNDGEIMEDHYKQKKPMDYLEVPHSKHDVKEPKLSDSLRYLESKKYISKSMENFRSNEKYDISSKQASPKFRGDFNSDDVYETIPRKTRKPITISSIIDQCLPPDTKKFPNQKKSAEKSTRGGFGVCDEIVDQMKNLFMEVRKSQNNLRTSRNQTNLKSKNPKLSSSDRVLSSNSDDSKMLRSFSANCLQAHLINPKPFVSRHTVASIQNMVSTPFQKMKMSSGTRNIRKEIKDKSNRVYLNSKMRFNNLPKSKIENQLPTKLTARNFNNRKAFK